MSAPPPPSSSLAPSSLVSTTSMAAASHVQALPATAATTMTSVPPQPTTTSAPLSGGPATAPSPVPVNRKRKASALASPSPPPPAAYAPGAVAPPTTPASVPLPASGMANAAPGVPIATATTPRAVQPSVPQPGFSPAPQMYQQPAAAAAPRTGVQPGGSVLPYHEPVKPDEYTVHLTRPENAGFGLDLREQLLPSPFPRGPPVARVEVAGTLGAAKQNGSIRDGDILVRVNGQPTFGMGFSEVVALFKTGNSVQLGLRPITAVVADAHAHAAAAAASAHTSMSHTPGAARPSPATYATAAPTVPGSIPASAPHALPTAAAAQPVYSYGASNGATYVPAPATPYNKQPMVSTTPVPSLGGGVVGGVVGAPGMSGAPMPGYPPTAAGAVPAMGYVPHSGAVAAPTSSAASASAGGVPGSTYAPQPGYAPPGSVAGVSGAAPASTGLPYTSPMSVVQPTAKRPRTMQAAAPSPPQQSEGYTAVLSSLVLRDVSDTVEPDVFDAAGAFTRFVTAHVTVGGTAGAPPVKADITLHASSKWGQNTDTMACLSFEDPDARVRAATYVSTEVFNTGGLMPFMAEAAARLAELVGPLPTPTGKLVHIPGPALARAVTATAIDVLFNSARPKAIEMSAQDRRSVPQFSHGVTLYPTIALMLLDEMLSGPLSQVPRSQAVHPPASTMYTAAQTHVTTLPGSHPTMAATTMASTSTAPAPTPTVPYTSSAPGGLSVPYSTVPSGVATTVMASGTGTATTIPPPTMSVTPTSAPQFVGASASMPTQAATVPMGMASTASAPAFSLTPQAQPQVTAAPQQ